MLVEDASAALELVYFNADPAYLKRLLPEGSRRLISGKLESYDGWLQMPHPDHVVAVDAANGGVAKLPLLEPIYPLTAGLTNTTLRKVIAQALARLPALPEWIDAAWRERNAWPSFADALDRMHSPETSADLEPSSPARSRLAYDELLANQLALAVIRAALAPQRRAFAHRSGKLRQAILARNSLQAHRRAGRALSEIDADLADPHRMLRLLQGDVGSGKTVGGSARHGDRGRGRRASRADGADRAARAPASQDHRQLRRVSWTEHRAPERSRERPRARGHPFTRSGEGRIDILIGTHALFQEPVAFRDLALVVIDEQHRFGVHQRLALQAKGTGRGAELLVMTATPIPARCCLPAMVTWTCRASMRSRRGGSR